MKKTIEEAIKSLQEKYPRVNYQGFLQEKDQPLLEDCLKEKDDFEIQIKRAISWFKYNPDMRVVSKCNTHADLGSLKHKVEKWVNNTEYLGYISRGAVLVAAECLGIPHTRDNLWISNKATEWPMFREQYHF